MLSVNWVCVVIVPVREKDKGKWRPDLWLRRIGEDREPLDRDALSVSNDSPT
jgi:hypothetical protein